MVAMKRVTELEESDKTVTDERMCSMNWCQHADHVTCPSSLTQQRVAQWHHRNVQPHQDCRKIRNEQRLQSTVGDKGLFLEVQHAKFRCGRIFDGSLWYD